VKKGDLAFYEGNCFLGIDAGSTTMKIVLISADGDLLYSWYGNNEGEPLRVCRDALLDMLPRMNPRTRIAYTCTTGYGEELLKNAFSLDEGEVETIAHFYAAKYFEPDVDCILDIGGQDMKFMQIGNGCVDNIVLNEACSSGCGSFIENFANSMGCTAAEFAEKAIRAKHPIDLGTRCTVFMNSNVKQAQKEGASIEDIAGGLAYSVIKNALFKVIKMRDVSDLGEKVVVQGGTFYNNAVLRCFELVSGAQAIRPDIAGLMGAFGAALIARERFEGEYTSMLDEEGIREFTFETTMTHCGGCQNRCRLTINRFSNGKRYISGNRCEKPVTGQKRSADIPNLVAFKQERMFGYEPLPAEEAPRGVIGIPRVLNMYEDFPFWAVFFRKLGFSVVISPFSDAKVYALGMDSIPSESECYPAKLSHGHVEWLIEHGVERIFYPCVYYERRETQTQQNTFNCPMVISYPESIRNNMESLREKNIQFYDPFIAFTNREILTESLAPFMKETFGIGKKELEEAVAAGWDELAAAKDDVLREGRRALDWIAEHGTHGIVLAGRPYHMDPEINHGIPETIGSLGFPVLTEDSIAPMNGDDLVKIRATNQWTYHARLYNAAQVIAERDDLELIQLNSFGCGLDAVTIDQVKEILESVGKLYTLLKIDEVNNLGAARIRIRSMIAAIRMREREAEKTAAPAETGLHALRERIASRFAERRQRKVPDYERQLYTQEMQDEKYTILCNGMVQPHFDFFEAAMRTCGYNMVLMRSESQNILDMGVKYVNNDACYPTMIVTGQILDEVASGKYNVDKLAVFMVQTGGGCRASNYVGFIRKALKDMGYPQIPVISINPGGMEKNPGMHYTVKMGFKILQSMVYGDILMKVVHRMRPYEAIPGTTDALFEKWHDICIHDLSQDEINRRKFHINCRDMIREFDRIPIVEREIPKVGIVGEVLVKYMPVANNHLADIIEAEGGEAVIPDFIEFISYCFWNATYRYDYLGGSKGASAVAKIVIAVFKIARRRVMREYRRSKHFEETTHLSKVKKVATEILQLGNQCGEGWYLAGEMICLIREKVENIVCVQPFGCLPNHVVGKGVIKKLKELYPTSNVVAVDYDPSASRVNQLNRIKLMLEVAAENIEKRRARRRGLSGGQEA
ncbi:MAG: 2-hydroxyacyl-CoA dehydratase, partial [Lachnospiraceae bacterium]|nr:2-hydroxyacyl-CoA dehydratase [Lachnospiraceae bacterium]